MIIDSFMFFNELDLLEGRLEYLYNHVDHFVLVESNMTHSGQAKPLHFLENKKRYKRFLDKIIHVPYYQNPHDYDFQQQPQHSSDFQAGTWQAENAQRNHIVTALRFFPDDAVVMVSDLDEIPHRDSIAIGAANLNSHWTALAMEQVTFCYNFNYRLEFPWLGSVIGFNSLAKQHGTQHFRNIKHGIPTMAGSGWHLTYWGTVTQIQEKIKGFAHQELNREEILDSDRLTQRLKDGKDLFNTNIKLIKTKEHEIAPAIRNIFGKLNQQLTASYDS
jgi:beta-1,4-mannosyl-glycoprotein beta-1,4-N-acetylglucosaminyltransferase